MTTFRTPIRYLATVTLLSATLGLTGCATDRLQTHKVSMTLDGKERTSFEDFKFPVTAKADQLVIFVVHMQDDTDKPYKKTVGYAFDNSPLQTLPSEMHSIHVFNTIPKMLKLDGICNDSEKFETRMPADGVIPLNHPYALRRQTEVDLSDSFEFGNTYVIQLSPFCFRNAYAGGLFLSKGSAGLVKEENGKYLIFKTKQATHPSTN